MRLNFFDNVATYFSILMASVVGLEVVDKSSTARKCYCG